MTNVLHAQVVYWAMDSSIDYYFFICVYTVNKLLKEEFSEEENDEKDNNENDENGKPNLKHKAIRQKTIRKFQRGIQKAANKSTRIQSSIQTTVSILAKYSLIFSFTIPEIPLMHIYHLIYVNSYNQLLAYLHLI